MSHKVLLVDDSGVMRKIILRSLNALGIDDVVQAADGQEAIDLFAQHEFTFVMTDWNMPIKTGLDVIKAIRATGSKVPIIMITTEAEKRQVLTAIQAGVSDYLTKPFQSDELRQKIEKFACV